MKRMGLEALYRKPNTSKPAPGHKIYPHLLRGMTIDRPNQVWAMDITYVPMARGFVYLAAVVDWFSRRHVDCANERRRFSDRDKSIGVCRRCSAERDGELDE